MAVKRHPGFEPQAVARAKADGRHFGHGQKRAGKALDHAFGHGNFKAILAGVARAGHPQIGAFPEERCGIHETHRGNAGDQPRQRGFRQRSLQRQQAAALDHGHTGHMGAQMGNVSLGHRGIDDQKQVIAAVRHHQIVQDAARVIGEHRIALPIEPQPRDIDRHQSLERRNGARGQDHLPHVAHVEQPRGGAGVQMLFQHPHRILHGHVPARKGDHLRPQFPMQIEKRRALQARIPGHRIPQAGNPAPNPWAVARSMPPLSLPVGA